MLKKIKERPSKLEKGYSQVLVKQTVVAILDKNRVIPKFGHFWKVTSPDEVLFTILYFPSDALPMTWPGKLFVGLNNTGFIKSKPGLIKSSRSVPGISDHCAVLTEAEINPPYRRSTARPVRQFRKSSWENIRKEIRRHWASFSKDSPNNSVNEKW